MRVVAFVLFAAIFAGIAVVAVAGAWALGAEVGSLVP